MATIKNRKKEPISIEKLKEMFAGSPGVEVEEYGGDGVARVSKRVDPAEQWWVDVRSIVESIPNATKREISKSLNSQISNRQGWFFAR